MQDTCEPSTQNVPKPNKARAKAHLLWPEKELVSCMPTGVVRDTRGANLAFNDRFNNFSTSPYCAISWIVEGECRFAQNTKEQDPRLWPALPKFVVSGPNQAPKISWNDGDVYAITVGFFPDAWFALTGIPVAQILNKDVDATNLLPDEFQPCFDLFDANSEFTQGFMKLQSILSPIWAIKRPSHTILANGLVDWVSKGLMQLSTYGVGRSARQVQRRIKHWTGLSHRELSAYVRSEELYKSFLVNRERDDVSMSQIAQENGYADQSHLGREVKRITGYSPKELDRSFDEEERFWFYRLLRDFY